MVTIELWRSASIYEGPEEEIHDVSRCTLTNLALESHTEAVHFPAPSSLL